MLNLCAQLRIMTSSNFFQNSTSRNETSSAWYRYFPLYHRPDIFREYLAMADVLWMRFRDFFQIVTTCNLNHCDAAATRSIDISDLHTDTLKPTFKLNLFLTYIFTMDYWIRIHPPIPTIILIHWKQVALTIVQMIYLMHFSLFVTMH